MQMPSLETLARNPLKERLAEGRLALSMIVRMARGPEIGRIAASAGFDALYVDLEHSVLSLETTAMICTVAREAGVVPLVRVPGIAPDTIGRVLDGGAMGIVVPHVECADDARAAIECALYPPLGQRSAATGQPLLHYRNFPAADAAAALNRSTFVAVMIESRVGLDNVESIAAVDGINMLFVGTHDLACDLGLSNQLEHPAIGEAFERVCAAARPCGLAVGAGGLAGQQGALATRFAAGVRFFSLGSDVAFLASAAAEQVRSFQRTLARGP